MRNEPPDRPEKVVKNNNSSTSTSSSSSGSGGTLGAILVGAVFGIIGLAVGGVGGAAAGFSLGYNLVNGTNEAIENQATAQHNQQVEQQNAADTLARQNLEKQNQQIAYQNQMRNEAAANKEREADVQSANQESRKAAIQAYQQASAGQAAEAQSGVSAGTPYMSLESQVNETNREIAIFWQGASAKIEASTMSEVSNMEGARLNYRGSDLNQTILGHQASNYQWEANKWADEASDATLWKNIGASVLNAVVSAWNSYTTFGAMDYGIKAAKSGLPEGSSDWDAITQYVKDAPKYKWAQESGDMTVFGSGQKSATKNITYNGGGLVVDQTALQKSIGSNNLAGQSGIGGLNGFGVFNANGLNQPFNYNAKTLSPLWELKSIAAAGL